MKAHFSEDTNWVLLILYIHIPYLWFWNQHSKQHLFRMMRTLAILLLATITIGTAQRIVSCEIDYWQPGDRTSKVESCNECAGRDSQGYGCGGECKWNRAKATCVHKVNNSRTYTAWYLQLKENVDNMVDCGNGIKAPTCRQCRSDIGDYECGGECTWHPERSNVCTWKSKTKIKKLLTTKKQLPNMV